MTKRTTPNKKAGQLTASEKFAPKALKAWEDDAEQRSRDLTAPEGHGVGCCDRRFPTEAFAAAHEAEGQRTDSTANCRVDTDLVSVIRQPGRVECRHCDDVAVFTVRVHNVAIDLCRPAMHELAQKVAEVLR